MKRLFKELTSFKVFIAIALVLAATSSILSIVAPNKLSDLTDEISKGLIVNKDNMEKIGSTVQSNLENIDVENPAFALLTRKHTYLVDENCNDIETPEGKETEGEKKQENEIMFCPRCGTKFLVVVDNK